MIVLNFHGIGTPRRELDDGEAAVWLERRQFAEILDLAGGRDDVRITFDDGNASDVSEALPELARRGLRAEFFICAGRLGIAEFLDDEGLRELRRAGMSLGSHGMDHVPWRRLDAPAVDREIVRAKAVLEDALQTPLAAAACPFGAYDRRTLSALRTAGFKRIYTSDGGRVRPTDWLAARNTVRREDSAESIERLLDAARAIPPPAARAKRWIKRWR